MTTQDGGVTNSDVQTPAEIDTNGKEKDNGGEKSDIQKQFDDLNAKFETLFKESKGKDAKISQLLK